MLTKHFSRKFCLLLTLFSLALPMAVRAQTVTVTSLTNPSTIGTPTSFTATVTASGASSGTVQFAADGVDFGILQLIVIGAGGGSQTTPQVAHTFAAAGPHTVTATYTQSSPSSKTSSGSVTQVVQAVPTVTPAVTDPGTNATLTSSVFGQSVKLSATVTGGFGTPTGSIQFSTPNGPVGPPVSLDSTGNASLTTSALPVGTAYTLTAQYSGDSFNTSRAGTLTYTVNKATPAVTTPTATPSATNYGQAVTLSSTVSVMPPGAGTPTGTINFSDGAGFSQSGPVDSSGTATVTTSTLLVGNHHITATYNPDSASSPDFTSQSSPSFLSLTVGADPTATGVTSSVNPSEFGQSVTFTVSVTNTTGSGTVPTGSVKLTYPQAGTGTFTTGAFPLNGTGQAQISLTDLAPGADSVTAAYTATGNFAGSDSTSSPLTQTVNTAATATSVASSANPAGVNTAVTFTATVATQTPGAGTPVGTVVFTVKQGGTTVYTSPAPISVSGSGNSATATDSYTFTAVSNYVVTAAFTASTTAPDAGKFSDSSGRLSPDQQITPSTGTTLTVSSSSPTSVFGQSVTFTATLGGLSVAPSGQVQFYDGGRQIGTPQTVALDPADSKYKATLTYPTAATDAPLSAGPHTITATYSGDPNNGNGSGSTTQTINPANTTTAAISTPLSASGVVLAPGPSTYGQAVKFTATVTNSDTGIAPSGSVTFSEGTTTLGSANLVAGSGNAATATFTTSSLLAGPQQITVAFVPNNANFNASDDSATPVQQMVNKAGTTTALNSTPNPSGLNASVTFTATVTNTDTSVTPAGTVTFTDTTNPDPAKQPVLGTASLSGSGSQATATFATAFAQAGKHTITASYNPSGGNFKTSNSDTPKPYVQTVGSAGTQVNLTSSSPNNTSVFGQPVTFTATIPSNGSVTAAGSIAFTDTTDPNNPVTLGTVTLSGGSASYTTTPGQLSAGSHGITAVFTPSNGNFGPGNSAQLPQLVNAAGTSTTATASSNPSKVGDTVTYTVTVTNTSGTGVTPTGVVSLSLDGGQTTFGNKGTLTPAAGDKSKNSATGTAAGVFTAPKSPYTVTVIYTPQDKNFSNSSVPIQQTVFNQPAGSVVSDQNHLLVPGTIQYANNGLRAAQQLRATDSQLLGLTVSNLVTNPLPTVFFNGNAIPSGDVTADTSSHLSVQVPASFASTAGLAQVQVVNSNSNGVSGSTTVPVNPVMAIPTYPVTSTRAYRMFSLPYDYSGFSPYSIVQSPSLMTAGGAPVTPVTGAGGFQYDAVNELLSGLIGFTLQTTDASYLALYHWDPKQIRYLTTAPVGGSQADSVPFVLGQAFWAVGAVGSSAPFLGVTRIGASAGFNPTGIPLQPGWNMVGDPFPTAVDLSSLTVSFQGVSLPLYSTAATPNSAVSQGVVGPVFWSYEQATDGTTGYQLNYGGPSGGLSGHNALRPYEGYWLYSYQPCTLLVSNTPPAGS